jgi:hypothetical protein
LDQFNRMAALADEYNNKESDKKTMKLKDDTQSQINLWLQAAENIFLGNVLYNSSINIE